MPCLGFFLGEAPTFDSLWEGVLEAGVSALQSSPAPGVEEVRETQGQLRVMDQVDLFTDEGNKGINISTVKCSLGFPVNETLILRLLSYL